MNNGGSLRSDLCCGWLGRGVWFIAKGLCRAGKLYYVTTAGGKYVPEEFGYGYIKALAQNFYGIKDTELFMATGLDIMGADTDAIMQEAIRRIETSVPV